LLKKQERNSMPLKNATHFLRLFTVLVLLALVVGCGGNGGGQGRIAGTPQPEQTGILVDSPVSGVTWTSLGSGSGITTNLGEFIYVQPTAGTFVETMTFTIGDILLGTAPAAPFITAVELTASFAPTDRAATNQLIFVQSIDADQDPTNGITISEATQAAAVGQSLDFDAPDFDTQVAEVVAAIAPGNSVVSAQAALDHFYTTYAALGGTDTFDFPFPGYPPVGEDAEEFQLIFQDEFDTGFARPDDNRFDPDAPNPDIWNIDQGYGPNGFGWGNNEWQLYTAESDNLRVEDGNLVITALCPEEPCGSRDGTITSGRITTNDNFEFTYGKVVARIKPPVGLGVWPAFWALGKDFPNTLWPRVGEIDFMEVYNNQNDSFRNNPERKTTSAMHWCDESIVPDPNANCFEEGGRIFTTSELQLPNSLNEDFQIWEADWDADRVEISINGIPYYTQEIDPVLMEEFRRDFFLLLNVAMGGTLGSGQQPPTGDETYPQTMLVDYVRVYQRVDDISPPELTQVGITSSNENPAFAASGDTVTVSLTANEAIVTPTVTIGGSAATTVTGSGTSWQASRVLTATETPGVIEFTIEFADLAGNDGFPVSTTTDSSEVTVDVTAPVLTSVNIASNNPNPSLATPGDIVQVTLAADETIQAPSITIGGTNVAAVGAGANWQGSRAVTGTDAEGPITFSIEYADFAGNVGVPVSETTDGSSVNVNTTSATVVILGAPATFNTLAPIPVTIEFSKAVTGFDVSDIQVTNGAAGGFVAVDAETYTAAVIPTGLGDLVIGVPAGAATDAAGTPSAAAGDVVVTSALDPDAPLLTAVNISSNNADPAFAREGNVVTLAITAGEAISTPTVTIAGGPAAVTGSGTSFQATRTALAGDPQGPIAFSIDGFQATDDRTPGFESAATTDGSAVTLDTVSPTLSIVGLPATLEFLEPLAVSFQFDEDVSGFELGDIVVTNGTIGVLNEVSADTYTTDITPDGVDDLTVAVAADAATDGAGNGSNGASETSIVDSAWQLIWSDDFEGGLDPSRWTARTSADCPDPCEGVQTYLQERVTVADGLLTIEARNEGGFTSGLIDTAGNLEFTFGRVEIDARMPGTQGTLPSLRLLPAVPAGETVPNYGPFPQSGEIDILNAPNLGPGNSTLEHALRYGLPEPEDTTTTATSTAPGVPTIDLITYAIEWDGGEIRWFVNDVHVATQTQDNWYAYFEDADGDGSFDAGAPYTLGTDAAPFDRNFYAAIGLAVGSNADSFFPQTLAIDAVRVYECANPVEPLTGAGCSTGTGVPPEQAPDAPYTETIEVYTDAPAILGFVEPEGTTSFRALQQTIFSSDPGNVVTFNTASPDGGNTVWNVNIQAPTGEAGVAMNGGTVVGGSPRYFDLSGGETAGEILFRMRVNSATPGVRLTTALVDRNFGEGAVELDFVADGEWRDYSIKIADIITASVATASAIDISDVLAIFDIAAEFGSVDLDLDDISVKVACRDTNACQATPRAESSVPANVRYSEDFEALDEADPDALKPDGGAGFQIFADVWDGEVGVPANFLYQYGPFPAPNPGAGPGFAQLINDAAECFAEAGVKCLNAFSDYNNQDHTPGRTCGVGGGSVGCNINTNVLRDIRSLGSPITAADIGLCWTFTGEYKAPFANGIADPASNATANAFIVTLDPMAGFAATNIDRFDTTEASNTDYATFSVQLDAADPALIGQILQIGFNTTATNFEDSGVYYDNLELSTRPGACPDPGP
jgi:beta-glucanase (GH16 family)